MQGVFYQVRLTHSDSGSTDSHIYIQNDRDLESRIALRLDGIILNAIHNHIFIVGTAPHYRCGNRLTINHDCTPETPHVPAGTTGQCDLNCMKSSQFFFYHR